MSKIVAEGSVADMIGVPRFCLRRVPATAGPDWIKANPLDPCELVGLDMEDNWQPAPPAPRLPPRTMQQYIDAQWAICTNTFRLSLKTFWNGPHLSGVPDWTEDGFQRLLDLCKAALHLWPYKQWNLSGLKAVCQQMSEWYEPRLDRENLYVAVDLSDPYDKTGTTPVMINNGIVDCLEWASHNGYGIALITQRPPSEWQKFYTKGKLIADRLR